MMWTLEDFQRAYLEQEPLQRYREALSAWEEFEARRRERSRRLLIPASRRFWQHLACLEPRPAGFTDFCGDTVTIGRAGELPPGQQQLLEQTLLDLRPWRKGPYNYFGIEVESEWRSQLKWNRVQDWIAPRLDGRVVADVGCNNAYYMYRMLPFRPELVVGFDPMERYFYHFLLNQWFTRSSRLQFELLGVDDLPLFGGFFDVIFFMGILYHRRNPVQALEAVCSALKTNGLLILESAGIRGEDPVCLFPDRRYMKAKGYWFLPTAAAVCNMLRRTGFYDIEVHGVVKTTPVEQSRTRWVNTESLEDFLDPADPEKTVEGYPAPYRIFISARKR